MERLYNGTEVISDEDQGGMSSWFVLSSMGICVCPGTDKYVIGGPMYLK